MRSGPCRTTQGPGAVASLRSGWPTRGRTRAWWRSCRLPNGMLRRYLTPAAEKRRNEPCTPRYSQPRCNCWSRPPRRHILSLKAHPRAARRAQGRSLSLRQCGAPGLHGGALRRPWGLASSSAGSVRRHLRRQSTPVPEAAADEHGACDSAPGFGPPASARRRPCLTASGTSASSLTTTGRCSGRHPRKRLRALAKVS